MTISITDTRKTYTGNGSTTAFPVPFRFDANADLQAHLFDAAGAGTLLTETTHYTLTGAGQDSGGTLTMITAPATGEMLVIARVSPGQQNMDLVSGGALSAESLETAFDKLTMESQEHRSSAGRSVRLHPLDSETDMSLPIKADRAGKVLGFDESTGAPKAGPAFDEVSNAQGYATAAEAAKTAAEAARAAAQTAETNAETAETNAETAETNAETARGLAEAARDVAIAASESMAWGFTFDSGTADADPGTAKFRFNHATFASATYMYISETADEGGLSQIIDIWDDSTSIIKATVSVRDPLNPSDWFQFYVTGTITDAGAYRKVPIQPIATNGTVANGTALKLLVQRNGDAGTGAVDSFNGRSGPVVPVAGDYSAWYAQLGTANTFAGELAITNSSPHLSFKESDGTLTHNLTRILQTSDTFSVETYNDSGTWVSTDYTATKGPSGTTQHEWRIGNVWKFKIDSAGKGWFAGDLDVAGALSIGSFDSTTEDLGTKTTGTHTMDVSACPLQKLVNGGAFTLAPGTVEGSCLLQITNNASAGVINTSGFTHVDGDDLTTTNGDDFLCQVTVINGFSILTVKALQ